MEVYLKTLSGKTIPFVVSPLDYVEDLKLMIQETEGIPMDQQRLVHSGKQLCSELPLCYYNIRHQSTIFMVLRLRGDGSGGSVSRTIGLTVGGAQDVALFRESIRAGKLPMPKSITYEGLFSEYFFETDDPVLDENESKTEEPLFYPFFSFSRSQDPLTIDLSGGKRDDVWISVGMNSNLKQEDFARPRLKLVFVLDISGSMSNGVAPGRADSNLPQNILEAATQIICAIIDKLYDKDEIGIVVFDDRVDVVCNLLPKESHDLDRLRHSLSLLKPRGGTNMELGYQNGINMMKSSRRREEGIDYEHRIIFLTDAQPNIGLTTGVSLLELTNNAEQSSPSIHTTFVGMGLNFQAALVDEISKCRGANYFSVNTVYDFRKRLDEEFDYFVAPLLYDLKLSLQSPLLWIDQVCGSPDVDLNECLLTSDGSSLDVIHVRTIFPSIKDEEGKTKGGIILLRARIRDGIDITQIRDEDMKLCYSVEYADRMRATIRSEGESLIDPKVFKFGSEAYFASKSMRKAILLTHYATLLKSWMIDTRSDIAESVENALQSTESGKTDDLEPKRNIVQVHSQTGRPIFSFRKDFSLRDMRACVRELVLSGNIPYRCFSSFGYWLAAFGSCSYSQNWASSLAGIRSSQEYREKFQAMVELFDKEIPILQDPTLANEIDLLNNILLTNVDLVPPNIMYIPQLHPDGCFVYASMMFKQDDNNRIGSTRWTRIFKQLMNAAGDTIEQVRIDNARVTFYGHEGTRPEEHLLRDDCSNPEVNEDLAGYFDIYLSSGVADSFDQMSADYFLKLSPHQALMILELEVRKTENRTAELVYVPHRFYHRYARNQDPIDLNQSKQRFCQILDDPMITSAFFSRIEPGKTHAFAAQKIETAPKDIAVSLPYWVFLDPLCGHPLIVGDSTTMLQKSSLAHSASILITRDHTREEVVLSSCTVPLY